MKLVKIRNKTIWLQPGDQFKLDGGKFTFHPADPKVLMKQYKYVGANNRGRHMNKQTTAAREFTQVQKDLEAEVLAARDHFDVTIKDGVKTYTFKSLRAAN